MNNYIESKYARTKVSITETSRKNLKRAIPKGCPFEGYTLYDLLGDLINMYAWEIQGCKTIKDFILLLQKEGNAYAMAYGNAIIKSLVD